MGQEELFAARTPQWADLQVVVVDTETTGLSPTSRVVSLAAVPIHAGRVFNTFSTLIDPGLPKIGASHIHGITAEILRSANAPAFASIADTFVDLLTPSDGKTVILARHRVVFDALVFNNELQRLGLQLPELLLLDTATVAQAVGVTGGTLAELATSVGVTPTDTHTAISDAAATAEILLRLSDILRTSDSEVPIENLATPFDTSVQLTRAGKVRKTRLETPPLNLEHQTAHAANLTDPLICAAALAVCVKHNCADLVTRCADGITSTKDAAELVVWIRAQLSATDLTRATRGRLLTALTVAVGRTDDQRSIREQYRWLVSTLPGWGTCGETLTDMCDRCSDSESVRSCRFVAARYGMLAAFFYRGNELDAKRAWAFLPYNPSADTGKVRRSGWFAQLMRSGDVDGAGYGAQIAARGGINAGGRRGERAVLEYAWAAGARNAKLADQLSKWVLTDGSEDPQRPHLSTALAIIDEALTLRNGQKGSVWESLERRRETVIQRQEAKPRKPSAFQRNGRSARPSPFSVR